MLNLNDLRCFVQVVDGRGFAPASRQLGIPKSTLSKRIAALEMSLSVRLIHRSSRRFVVTDLGREFYRHAKAALIEAEAAEQVVRGRLTEPSGTVRLTASVPTAQYRLAPFLPKLARMYPRLLIELQATDRFVDLVQEGFDVGIRDHFSPLVDSELVGRLLASDPIVVVGSKRYLRGKRSPRRPEELVELDGLLTSHGAAWGLNNDAGERIEVRPRSRLIADESRVLLQAATAGLGVTCLPLELCHAGLEAGQLVRVLPNWTAGSVSTSVLMPHRRGQVPSVRLVVDALVEYFAG